MEWLHDTTIRLAADAGLDPAAFAIDARMRSRLLKVARDAAHGSGDRTNAPLLCYVLGLMAAQGYDVARSLDVVAEAIAAHGAGDEAPA